MSESNDPDPSRRLPSVLQEATGWDVCRIDGLERLSGGASRETWSFDAIEASGTRHELILQRLRDTLGFDRRSELGAELEVLVEAERAGAPVAHLVAGSSDASTLGAPFLVTERLEGETLPQRILKDDAYASARAGLAAWYGEALAKIQKIPLERVPSVTFLDPLKYCRESLDQSREVHPVLELGLRWLEANRPATGDTVVVHGDFRSANCIVDPNGLKAIIDWELVHLGDPLEDMGWCCIRAWRYGHQLPVGGFGSYDEFIGAYESISGTQVDREALRWWQVAATVRWAVICVLQAATHLSGRRRSIELAVVGRRACEAEFDLMLLLP
jgi:aminoglycoside phosphotransferase (APT) family kinase protein